MNNYEKGQGYSNRKQRPDASRDGKIFEKRELKPFLKRLRATENSYKPVQKTFKTQKSEQPVSVNKTFGEKKPYKSFSEQKNEENNAGYNYKARGEKPFTPYHNSDKPRFNSDKPRYNSDKPRYGDKPHFNNDKPRFNTDKPRFNSDKPHFNSDKPYSNRYNNRDEKGTGNRYFNKDENRSGDRISLKKRDDNYDPNAKYSHKKQSEYRKTYIDPNKPIRLNRFLANAGICSRREADEFIQAGVVSINGEVVSTLGTKVLPTDSVMFHNQPVRSERKVYILLNKPKDCITTAEDTHARTTVLDIVKNACSERVYPVGRLDRNTTGVILLTNDGDLAVRLTHPKFDKKKIYHIVLDRPIETVDFEAITAGVQLDDNTVIAADALEFIKDDDKKQLGIEIHSGQNRVVRRIFEKLGYHIVRLDRVYFAGLTKKNLPRGKYRFLTEREINMLKMSAYE